MPMAVTSIGNNSIAKAASAKHNEEKHQDDFQGHRWLDIIRFSPA